MPSYQLTFVEDRLQMEQLPLPKPGFNPGEYETECVNAVFELLKDKENHTWPAMPDNWNTMTTAEGRPLFSMVNNHPTVSCAMTWSPVRDEATLGKLILTGVQALVADPIGIDHVKVFQHQSKVPLVGYLIHLTAVPDQLSVLSCSQ